MADSAIYDKLTTLAKDFILSMSPKTPGTNEPDPDRFLSYTASNFKHSWGHKFFVSTSPGVQGEVDAQEFLKRMAGLAGKMQTWQIEITECCVDVQRKAAALKTDYNMTIAGHEPVVNEIVWWLNMDESGEKLVASCEYIDPTASAELIAQMQGNS